MLLERLIFYVRHSINDLKVNRLRSFFALLCIAAGVGAIVSLQTLAEMMTETLTETVSESNRGDIQLSPSGEWRGRVEELEEEGFSGGSVFTEPGVTWVSDWFTDNYPGSEVTYRQAVTGTSTTIYIQNLDRDTDKLFVWNFIVDKDAYPLYGTVETEDGRALSEVLRESNDIVISRLLADDLLAEEGDTLRLSGGSEDFIVRGIVPNDAEGGWQNIAANLFGYFYLDLDAVSLFDPEEMPPGYASTIYVKLPVSADVDDVEERFFDETEAINATTTTDLEEANEIIGSSIDDMVVIMGLISLLIGGIGIVNTMLVIVSRRTTEVAVLKTIGLEPREVVQLFLVEAVLMGIIGSILGVGLGWLLAFLTKGIAERFLGQSLIFAISLAPVVRGLVVGVAITTIFGFLPTLAAGQIRPATILRPSEAVVPRAGRISAFIAIVLLIMALSLVAQGLMHDLLGEVGRIEMIAAGVGAVYGVLIALAAVVGGVRSMQTNRRERSWVAYGLLWMFLLGALPAAGAVFGYYVPAILVLSGTVIVAGYLYVTLWFAIWAMAGGSIYDIWPGVLILLFPLFWPLFILIIPLWIIGWLIQKFAWVDLKIAMRSMLAQKGRGASTLLALVVGVFTLSIMTMLVDSITNAFAELLEDAAGGNVMIVNAQDDVSGIEAVLQEETDAVRSFTTVYSYEESQTGTRLDGRRLDRNLPDLNIEEGRNLDPALDAERPEDGAWPAVITADEGFFVNGRQVEVGDLLTYRFGTSRLSLRVVGIAGEGMEFGDADLYAPQAAFEEVEAQPMEVLVIADIHEDKISQVRRRMAELPGTFMIEIAFINDLLNRIIDQFTSFPLLVAGLALFTGGVVIANSVALSTMERKREIGIMKAVGLQRERVLGMLLLENTLMGIIGGLIGVGGSFLGLLYILIQLFEEDLGRVVPYQTAFALMALCIGISLFAAIFTVWGASGEKPLNTLRYE